MNDKATESNPASLDIPAIRAMAEAATPGPWRASHYDDGSGLFEEGSKVSAPGGTLDGCIVADLADDEGLRGAREDAEFIAACRTAVPLLCDRIDEQAREIERLRGFAKEVLRVSFDGGSPDGGDIQEMGVRHGLLAETQMKEPCGESCMCAEVAEFPAMCFRFTAVLGDTDAD